MAADTVSVNHVEFVAVLLVAFQRLEIPEEISELFTIRTAELVTLYETGWFFGLGAVLHGSEPTTGSQGPKPRVVIYRRLLESMHVPEVG